jgi:hypothetical protein
MANAQKTVNAMDFVLGLFIGSSSVGEVSSELITPTTECCRELSPSTCRNAGVSLEFSRQIVQIVVLQGSPCRYNFDGGEIGVIRD